MIVAVSDDVDTDDPEVASCVQVRLSKVNPSGVAPSLTVFGAIAAIVASYKGLTAKGGPKGVGDAVNQSVVITFMFLFVVNFVASAVYFQVVPQRG